jgi:hypothetical protein
VAVLVRYCPGLFPNLVVLVLGLRSVLTLFTDEGEFRVFWGSW